MYIIKIKGNIKIPDYVQIRDDKFTLLAYFRADRPEKAITKIGLDKKLTEMNKIILNIPYGKLQKLEF